MSMCVWRWINSMAFSSLSPPHQSTLVPNISIKHGSCCNKMPYCNQIIKFLSPPTYAKIRVSISNLSTGFNRKLEERKLPEGLEDELMPKHVGLIIDGNRRWALERGCSPMAGHTAGRMTLKSLLCQCCRFQIKAVTVFLFSTENWNRPTVEVEFLMALFGDILAVDGEELFRLGCRVTVMGNISMLPKTLQEIINKVEERSAANSGTHVNFAINYSGKYDITEACKRIASKVKDGIILAKDINDSSFERELGTRFIEFPCLDLLIRTSGEIRVSNFMLWELAYSELYFVKKLFPDFQEKDLIEALHTFQRRRLSRG